MVVDTSALVAMFLAEPEHRALEAAVDEASEALVSVVSRVELTAVLCGGRVAADPEQVERFVRGLGVRLVAVTAEQTALALRAILTFGKGRHPAKLNLGDCFAYALAKSLDAPLLFKGEDFARTDVVPAWRPSESIDP
jgi:ribonuclease VapC